MSRIFIFKRHREPQKTETLENSRYNTQTPNVDVKR